MKGREKARGFPRGERRKKERVSPESSKTQETIGGVVVQYDARKERAEWSLVGEGKRGKPVGKRRNRAYLSQRDLRQAIMLQKRRAGNTREEEEGSQSIHRTRPVA